MPRLPVEIIAEIANAHQGDLGTAVTLAEAAFSAGADAVKFQVYIPEALLVRAHPRFEHFQQQAFAPNVWEQLLSSVVKRGGRVYCDVFDEQALAVASRAGVGGYKVHSSDLANTPLLRAVALLNQRVFLGVGGSTVREIDQAIRILTPPSGLRPILLYGFQSYPTAVEDACLARLEWLQQIFGDRCDVGYMDHVDGDDPFAITLPLLAVAMGARVLEKHITLDRSTRGVDYYSSLNPDEFAQFVAAVRRAERSLGDAPDQWPDAERAYRQQVKKHWVTTGPLNIGHVLTVEDLAMKQVAAHSAEVVELQQLLGRPLLHQCGAEHPLTRADVPQTIWAMVIARMSSTRLPGKALADMAGMPALQHLFERLKQARSLDRIVLCTTCEPADDVLAELAHQCEVHVFRGPTEDVLARMVGALEGHAVDIAIRVTGDDILVDPDYLDHAVEYHRGVNAEYTAMKALPSGTEVEVFDVTLLRTLAALAKDSQGTEYLTSYVTRHRDQFRVTEGPVDAHHRRNWRLTLDTNEDAAVLRSFLTAMAEQGKGLSYRMDDVVTYFLEHPEVLSLNANVRQRETPIDVCTDLVWQNLT